MPETPICQVPRIGRPEQGRRLSLQLVKLACLDETEHEGIWPFVGEGIANDAIRLTCAVTTRSCDNQNRSRSRAITVSYRDDEFG